MFGENDADQPNSGTPSFTIVKLNIEVHVIQSGVVVDAAHTVGLIPRSVQDVGVGLRSTATAMRCVFSVSIRCPPRTSCYYCLEKSS